MSDQSFPLWHTSAIGRESVIFLQLTVLLSDRSGLRGVKRPVDDQGKRRLGSTEFVEAHRSPILIGGTGEPSWK